MISDKLEQLFDPVPADAAWPALLDGFLRQRLVLERDLMVDEVFGDGFAHVVRLVTFAAFAEWDRDRAQKAQGKTQKALEK